MPRLALELISAPPGVSVGFGPGDRFPGPQDGDFTIGLARDSAIAVEVEPWAWDEFCRNGWGGRRNTSIVVQGGRWRARHLGHAGTILLNGEVLVGEQPLGVGDRLEPSRGLVFEVVDLDALPPRPGEPPELLDAVADAPEDMSRWHVLADWLIEHQAPHALMAAYELKLEHGTNDPDLLGDYASIRRRRHVLSELRHDHVTWCCGYVVSCSVWLGPRDPDEVVRLTRAFAAPQFAALSRLTLQCNGTESSARLEGVLGALPKTVRTVGLQFSAPAPLTSLLALKARPPKAHTVRLHLADPLAPLTPLIEVLVASGWRTIELEATRLTDRGDELRALVARYASTRFMLGGTYLSGHTARALSAPNVAWTAADHDALLVDVETGTVLPLSRTRRGSAWGLPVAPFGAGWSLKGRDWLLTPGDHVVGAGRRFVFLTGPALDDVYRAWLEAWTE